jgi:hypothetical protein
VELPDYWLSRPGPEPDPQLRASFDRVWDDAMGSGKRPLIEVPPGERWRFLCHLADTRGVVLHGSGDPGIEVFEPRQAIDLGDFGNQQAVYAAGDGLWAMFFAIVDRDRIPSVTNACVRLADAAGEVSPPRYVFSISRSALPDRPWRSGTVYVLPGDTFELQPPMRFGDFEVRIPQLASFVAVRPIARVAVEPDDFPFLSQIRGHDDDRLAEYAHAMETGAPWPDSGPNS